jgi:hypothetical protein
MADDWVDVPAAAAPPAAPAGDGWEDVPKAGAPAGPAAPISGPNGWSEAAKPMINSTSTGSIMRAFGEGFGEAWGPERLGLSKESTQWLSEKGIFAPAGQAHYENPFQAFNEGVIVNTATALDAVARGLSGAFRGGQAATMEALGGGQFGREIAAIPEAFMGSPGSLGKVEMRSGLPKDRPVGAALIPLSAPEIAAPLEALGISKDAVATEQPHLVVARKMPDGTIKMGAVGEVHSDLMTRKEVNSDGPTPPEIEASMGYAKPDGTFLNREEALKYATRNEPARARFSAEQPQFGLEASSYNDVQVVDPVEVLTKAGSDLGVIGPEKPPITEGTPKEVAERVTSANAEGPKGEKVTQELPGDKPNPWRERFDEFVGKINTPADAKQLITDAADQNGEFQAARQGTIPLQQFEAIADAAGVDKAGLNPEGIGRLLQNDNQVRNAMQAMLTATDNVRAAAREVKTDGSPESLMKLQEAMLRRDTWVEQVVGHRAEWGRTGNVFQEFLQKSKEEGGFTEFLKDKDQTPEGLKKLADAIDGMDGAGAARFLSDMNKPSAWDKFRFYWINALISGPITHAKYIVANGAFAAYESAVVTPVAGVVGAVRRGLMGDVEGVYAGEAAARTWGIIAGVPDAIKAGVAAAKTGLQTALPGELAQSIIPKQNKNLAFQQRPIPGNLGAVIGAPSRGASAIHSFFNALGYRASIEAQAYRAAAADGLKLSDDAFWNRRASAADRPTPDMMNNAIEEGYRLTYISELGETGKKLSSFVSSTKVGQLVMPFTHIPLNILKRSIEGTPAAFLDKETRAALSGEAGAAKQDMAIARMVVGSAVGAWAVNQVLNERMTGFGPTDPKERAQWTATGHQPYSIRIGDYWYSFNRFGSLGTMLGLYSNLAEVIPHVKPDWEELTKAIGMTVHSTGRLMEDEVGMQGLAGLMDAINEPDRKGAKFVANFAGSLLPYSSMQRQVASAMDPYMRETKSVVDGLRYYIPTQRQGLDLKRDWLGLPVANAGYGGDVPNAPGLSAIIQHRNAVVDPIAQEMQTLDLHPAPPQNRIAGVKLPPKIYDAYQSTAGAFTREALTHFVEQPGWHEMPPFVRQQMFKATIDATRKSAGAAIQMQYPQIIQQGVEDRVAKIRGEKPTKLKDPSLTVGPSESGTMGIRG